jgi:hypothetical protein
MSYRIINANVLDGLASIASDSVHVVITSPPYWSLRDYGVAGQLGLEKTPGEYIDNMVKVFREVRRVMHPTGTLWLNMGDSYCSDAGALRAPTTLSGPRVPSGWTNRAQTHRAHALRAEAVDPENFGRWNKEFTFDVRHKQDIDPKRGEQCGAGGIYKGVRPQGKLKPKDMVMMPARLAIALQDDGWFLRAQIPWIKSSSMPESVNDRPVTSIEYVYMFSKTAECYYDKHAVLVQASKNSHSRGKGTNPKAMGPNSRMKRDQDPDHQSEGRIKSKQNRSFSAAVTGVVETRARRTSDWFFASLQNWREDFKGMLVDDDGEPLAMLVNAQPFTVEMCASCDRIYAGADYRALPMACRWPPKKKLKDDDGHRVCSDCQATEWLSHFATFPERLVEPCLLAGTSEHGACQNCGAPFERIVEQGEAVSDSYAPADDEVNTTAKWSSINCDGVRNGDKPHTFSQTRGSHQRGGRPAPATTGWRRTCDGHPLFPCGIEPCTVLDPFSGSARTGLVAVRNGRNYIGIELRREYALMGEWQLSRLKTPPDVDEIGFNTPNCDEVAL